jgi:PAS domain S-box-containing protein
MRASHVAPTGRERFFPEDEIIVSKTDLKGRITYVNQTFMTVADFTEEELLGQPHSIIRHPDMPRCVFKLLWDTLEAKSEIFAFVKNMAKNGDHYWVLAHVTPTFDERRNVTGYHSNRRVPERKHVELFDGIYGELLAEEKRFTDWRAGMESAGRLLEKMIAAKNMEYEEFVFSV